MNVGIIGCGNIALAHAKALAQIEMVETLILFDRDNNQMDNIEKNVDVNVVKAKQLEDLAIKSDAFIVCTPNNLHKSMIEKIIKIKAIPFVCEKPLAASIDDAKTIMNIAPRNSIVSFNYRYNHILKSLKKYTKDNDLGECLFFSAKFNKNSAIVRNNITWRDEAGQNSSSGALGDLSCHLLDFLCWLNDDIIDYKSIKIAKGTRIKKKQGLKVNVDDNGFVLGRSKKGMIFNIKASKSEKDEALGLHLHMIYRTKEILFSTVNTDYFIVRDMDDLNNKIISTKKEQCITDPERELPYWSDSFGSVN